MIPPSLHVYDITADLFEKAVQRILELGVEAIEARGEFHLALSGGSTPRALYRCLGAPAMQRRLDWQRVHLWFGDERCVPPDHADSNYRMAREALIDHIPIDPGNVHRMEGELSPEEGAQRYEEALAILPRNAAGDPVFDLILLGLGPDGHIASLFPGSPALSVHDRSVTSLHVARMDSWRLTLTLPVLNNARHLMVVVSGEKKADVLRHLFYASPDARPLPAQQLEPTAGCLEWYIDHDAARYLHSETVP